MLAVLHVEGEVNTDWTEGLQFLRHSPLERELFHTDTAQKIQATGPLQLHLHLAIPLEHTATRAEVAGQLTTQNSNLTLPYAGMDLHHLQGQINFTRDSINSPAITAQLGDKPIKIMLASQQATMMQVWYDDFAAQLQRQPEDDGWVLALKSPNVRGQIAIPKDKQQAWRANFQRLHLQADARHDIKKWSPMDIPRLNLTSADFRYGTKQFGRVQLQLAPLPNGVEIKNLQAASKNYTLSAKGTWRRIEDHDQTQLQGTLSSADINAALVAWGLPAGLRAEQSAVQFDLSWPDVAYHPTFKQSSGQVALNFERGQIADIGSSAQMKIDIGRLLNLLSLQSLGRRLKLDFTDFKAEGFNFDTLKGNFVLQAGNAITHDTELSGQVAQVGIAGRVGLEAEDCDLRLKVVPHLTASLPMIAGLAGGPIVGFATWAASKILSPAVNVITSYDYQMTGPWANPQVVKAGAGE